MSSNKTSNYQLHAWAAGDDFLRSEMNENFEALDSAVKAEETARAGAVSSINTTLSAKATTAALNAAKTELEGKIGDKATLVVGSYTGDGTAERFLDLGRPILALLLENDNGARENYGQAYTSGGLILPQTPLRSTVVSISGTSVCLHGTNYANVNHSGYVYSYLAWVADI